MIQINQLEWIKQSAYIPEHLVPYVTSISQTEPFLMEEFLVYVKKDLLIFIGYSLKALQNEERMRLILEDSIFRFRPNTVSFIAPMIPSSFRDCLQCSSDSYYRLDLNQISISSKTRNMLRRAGRELLIEKSKNYNQEHERMVEHFIQTHSLNEETQLIYKSLKKYIHSSPESWMFNARNPQGDLVAFDIAEFGSKEYAFYMFNFTSKSLYVPGASDLLLYEIIKMARAENKRYINLGLGINPGVTFFKKKWGGVPFLPYVYCLYTPSRLKQEMIESLIHKL